MTTSKLLSLGFAVSLAFSAFGCAAAMPAAPAVAEAPAAQAGADGGLSQESAERVFGVMAERCLSGSSRGESTKHYCEAAEHLARTVLHDEQRAEALEGSARAVAASGQRTADRR